MTTALTDDRFDDREQTRVMPAVDTARPATRVVERRTIVRTPSPPLAWYERVPSWVSGAVVLNALVLLLALTVIASPATFGLAEQDATVRREAALSDRIEALEVRLQQVERTGAVPAASSSPSSPSPGIAAQLAGVESRLAQLCARATPPC